MRSTPTTAPGGVETVVVLILQMGRLSLGFSNFQSHKISLILRARTSAQFLTTPFASIDSERTQQNTDRLACPGNTLQTPCLLQIIGLSRWRKTLRGRTCKKPAHLRLKPFPCRTFQSICDVEALSICTYEVVHFEKCLTSIRRQAAWWFSVGALEPKSLGSNASSDSLSPSVCGGK